MLPPLVIKYHATTFAERGLAVPFTTAVLSGSRLRQVKQPPGTAASRSLIEVILPNLSEGRGVYIVPWSDVQALFRPTVHDRRLGDALAAAMQSGDQLRPATIRRIAREVAMEGFAGRAAAAAAAQAHSAEEARIALCAHQLLVRFVKSIGLAVGRSTDQAAMVSAAGLQLGWRADALGGALVQTAKIIANSGLTASASDAPLPMMLTGLAVMMRDIQSHTGVRTPGIAAARTAILTMGEATIQIAQRSLAALHAYCTQLPELFRGMIESPGSQMARLERIEWALDGWQQLALMWRAAEEGAGRGVAMEEMARLLPRFPEQAEDWFGLSAAAAAQLEDVCRHIHAGGSRGPPVIDAVARNEQMREWAA